MTTVFVLKDGDEKRASCPVGEKILPTSDDDHLLLDPPPPYPPVLPTTATPGAAALVALGAAAPAEPSAPPVGGGQESLAAGTQGRQAVTPVTIVLPLRAYGPPDDWGNQLFHYWLFFVGRSL